jgi:prolyl-tRNA synthetase
LTELPQTITGLLDTIQRDMFQRAVKTRNEQLKYVTEWNDFVPALNAKNLVMIPWCEQVQCEESIKERSTKV